MGEYMNWMWVFLGGGIGSLMRFGIGKVNILKIEHFPLGTLLANILASAILGIVVCLNIKFGKYDWYWPFFAVGVCGGFSTFSTFSMENIQLLQQGNYAFLVINVLVSLLLTGLVFYFLAKSSLS